MPPLRFARLGVSLAAIALAGLTGCADDGRPPAPTAALTDPSLRPAFTAASGTKGTLLGRSTFADPSKNVFKSKWITGQWNFELMAKPAFDLAVQVIEFPAGSSSGWHSHSGPVFIQVTKGKVRFYDSDDPTCTPIEREEGQGFLDTGDHPHFARNESGLPAQNVVTYFAPPGEPLRKDEPRPGNCPF